MKKFIAFALSLMLMFTCLSGAALAADEPLVIKISVSETAGSIFAQTVEPMAEEITEKTNGAVTFEMYYSNELGSLADVTEQMTMGGNLMTATSGDFFADYGCHDILSSALFFAVPDQEALKKLNDSDLFASWCDQIQEASGIKILACNWAAAPRNIISTKPINSVDDIKGLKIRVPGTAADAFFSALDASTMTMPFSEVYTNLDSGMIDAAEAALGGLYDYGLHEVAKNVYLSQHSLAPACVAVSASVWDQLSEENRQILQEVVNKYGDVYTEQNLAQNEDYRAKMEEAGVTFVEPSEEDIERLKAAGAESFSAFPDLSEGLAEQLAEVIS